MEQVHHVFEVPNVKVVLAINQRALEQSIQQMYGPDYDAERYIRRFVHEVLQLPAPPTGSVTEFIKKRVVAASSDPTKATLDEIWDPYRILTVAISSPGRSMRDTDIIVRLMSEISAEIEEQYDNRRPSVQHLSYEQFTSCAALLIALRLISPQSYRLLVQQPTRGLQVWQDLQDHLSAWFDHMYTDPTMMNDLWILCAYLIAIGGTGATNGSPTVDDSALGTKKTRSPFRNNEHAELKLEVVKLRGGTASTGPNAGQVASEIELPIRTWAAVIDRRMPLTQA